MITNLTQSGKLSTLESVEYGRFEALFQNIMHVKPFLWQWRLFNRFLHNDLPDVIDIPTGLGKTSVMAIWLLARAFNPELPRRLIYVVDRKAVVDQATTIAEQLRQSLADNPSCSLIAEKLGIDSQNPIPISTLRGKLADNRAWLEDATCPAIIIGTIDMIGSRLLFSGYRTSKWMRPMQAALMTVDSLILLDEAHLSPTFVQVLSFVHSCRQMENLPFKLPSLHILPLSATAQTKDTHQSFRLDSEDVHDAPVAIRLAALKRLKFVNVKGGLAEELGNRAAIWDEKCKCVAVFCNGRADAQKAADTIRQKLGKGRINDVRLLTGARRGYERDCLAKHETFRAFQGKDPTDGRTRYLVCTSAGEVGVDLDAQHSVMDLVSLERMIQRLGRINRRGEMSGGSRVEVLVDDEKLNQHIDNMPDLVTVREVLMSLPKLDNDDHNASPQSVDNLLKNLSQELRQRVFTPAPPSPLLNFAHIEAWSLTSTDEHPGRPEIAPFVRGIVPDEVQTEIIWREDISLLTRLDSGKIEQAIESIPPNPSEILVEMTRSLTDKFVKRLEKWKEGNSHSAMPFSFLVVRGDHVVEIITIEKGLLFGRNGAQFSTIPKKLTSELIRLFSYSTLWLPYEFGGLDEDGLFSANTDNAVTEPPKNEFSALRLEVNLNTEAERPLGGAWPFDLDHEENWEKTLRGKRWRRIFKQYLPPENGQADSESVHALEYWVPPKSGRLNGETGAASTAQSLKDHHTWTQLEMARIADRLKLDGPIKNAMSLAARHHDQGKGRELWQNAMKTDREPASVERPLAKTGNKGSGYLGGYRHEFGSLMDAMINEDIMALDEAHRDLALHLITAHHGRGRVFIPAYDPNIVLPAVLEEQMLHVAKRFARLQKLWGPWGLAWLETLLRIADVTASRKLEETPHE